MVHPPFKTPWVAALVMAVIGAVLTASSDIAVVVTFTGVVLIFTYAFIALSAIVVGCGTRICRPHYQMPLWPIWPVIALAGVVYVLTQQSAKDVLIVLGSSARRPRLLLRVPAAARRQEVAHAGGGGGGVVGDGDGGRNAPTAETGAV